MNHHHTIKERKKTAMWQPKLEHALSVEIRDVGRARPGPDLSIFVCLFDLSTSEFYKHIRLFSLLCGNILEENKGVSRQTRSPGKETMALGQAVTVQIERQMKPGETVFLEPRELADSMDAPCEKRGIWMISSSVGFDGTA